MSSGADPRKARSLRRSVGWIYAFAVFFGVVGAIELVIGGHDVALSHPALGVTTASALLLLTGVFSWVAAWQLDRLCRRTTWEPDLRPACHPVVLVAFVLTIIVGFYAAVSALETPSSQRYFVALAAAGIAAVGVVGLLFFGRDLRLTLPRVGAAVALAVLGTAVGAWEFWYQNRYTPSHAGGAVALHVHLTPLPRQGELDVVRATVDYEAAGGKSVSVVASVYTLTASKLVRCARTATVKRVGDYFQGFLLDPQRVRFMADILEGGPVVLAAGKFVADGKELNPQVPADREFVFCVPHGRYQLLRFRAQLFAVPASIRLSQQSPPQYVLGRDNEVYGYWHIDDPSWFHQLVFGRERWLLMRYELVDPGDKVNRTRPAELAPVTQTFHVLARFPEPTWSRGTPSAETTRKRFDRAQAINAQEPADANEPFADAELPLGQVTDSCPGS